MGYSSGQKKVVSPTAQHGYWGRFTVAAELPNVAGSTVQSPDVDYGDLAWSDGAGALYNCTDPTLGAAVWAPLGSAAAGADPQLLVFRPGGVADGVYVFDAWADLMVAVAPLAAVGAWFKVLVDVTQNAGAYAVPAGAYDFGGAGELWGQSGDSDIPYLTFDGVTLTGIRHIEEVHLQNEDAVNGVFVLTATTSLTMGPRARLGGNTIPIITLSPTAQLYLTLYSWLGTTSVGVEEGGVVQIECFEGAHIPDEAVVMIGAGVAPTVGITLRSLDTDVAYPQSTVDVGYFASVTQKLASFGALSVPAVADAYYLLPNGGEVVAPLAVPENGYGIRPDCTKPRLITRVTWMCGSLGVGTTIVVGIAGPTDAINTQFSLILDTSAKGTYLYYCNNPASGGIIWWPSASLNTSLAQLICALSTDGVDEVLSPRVEVWGV